MTVTEAVTALPAQIQCFIEREESSLQDLTVTVTEMVTVTETVTESVTALPAEIRCFIEHEESSLQDLTVTEIATVTETVTALPTQI